MTHILIIIAMGIGTQYGNNGIAIDHIEFTNKQACEKAKDRFDRIESIRAYCVEKS